MRACRLLLTGLLTMKSKSNETGWHVANCLWRTRERRGANHRDKQTESFDVQCLSVKLHHRPNLLPAALEALLEKHHRYNKKYHVVYGDCGTAGGIDRVLQKYQAERKSGPRCFSFFEGNDNFANSEDNLTSFFFTDLFCRHFYKFIWQEFGIEREKSMVELLFGNYKKVVYLAQTENAELKSRARKISKKLELEFEYRYRGYRDLGIFIENIQ